MPVETCLGLCSVLAILGPLLVAALLAAQTFASCPGHKAEWKSGNTWQCHAPIEFYLHFFGSVRVLLPQVLVFGHGLLSPEKFF